jgi:hypothetical protein
LLLQLGCIFGQGNGIAHPMPGEDLPAWSAAWIPDPTWIHAVFVAPGKRTLVHAAVAHRAWVTAMESFLVGGRRAPPTLDPHRCRFGRWLDGERRTSMAEQLAFHRVDQLHMQLHERAISASALETVGPRPEVEVEVRELHRVRDALLEQMNLLLLDADFVDRVRNDGAGVDSRPAGLALENNSGRHAT